MTGLHDKFWAKKRKEKKHARERTALAEHEHELARLDDAGDATPAASQKTLYLLHKSAARKPPRKNAPRRAKVRRDQRRAPPRPGGPPFKFPRGSSTEDTVYVPK